MKSFAVCFANTALHFLVFDKFQFVKHNKMTPTDLKNLSGLIICFLRCKFTLSVGETCGLPRANTVRPYRVFKANFLMRTSLSASAFFYNILSADTENSRAMRSMAAINRRRAGRKSSALPASAAARSAPTASPALSVTSRQII